MTAFGQVMRYFQWPITGIGTKSLRAIVLIPSG
ncbi:MAG: C10 family peptidase [Synergistaceae bacterium]|nr:C10 family peptidase [Synergistaceae bacterium]